MFRRITLITIVLFLTDCKQEKIENQSATDDETGGSARFKIPLVSGYDWEITQSWGEHCEECDQKYPSSESYCNDSHTWNCCTFAWDLNLPGNSDSGKPVLASAEGTVKEVFQRSSSETSGWGNYIILDHGDNLCTRYAHLLDDSIRVRRDQQVCQGLKIAEIGGTPNYSPHLHFQFEECHSEIPVAHSFDDGNKIPMCTKGRDLYDSHGQYQALRLTNRQKKNCENENSFFNGEPLPEGGWLSASCGALDNCPMLGNCGRSGILPFADANALRGRTKTAVDYLWRECAIDGKSDNRFHQNDFITKAEALKVTMFLFGLMENCGSDGESFADVDQDDWYFPVVACAVRHRVINNVSAYFAPNREVNFAEAAKFAVEPAVKAGIIELQNPQRGHFAHVSANHWSYPYFETLYFYGGLQGETTSLRPENIVTRGQYALMVAALSPCFCGNVACEGNCICGQSVFSCVDPEDQNEGTGGQEEETEEPAEKTFELELSCWAVEDQVECHEDGVELYLRCEMENQGEETVRVNNLIMSLINNEDVCFVSDEDLRTGVGTNHVEPGETETLSGHFEVICSELPSEAELQMRFDLVERIAGENTTYENLLRSNVEISEMLFQQCQNKQPVESVDTGSGEPAFPDASDVSVRDAEVFPDASVYPDAAVYADAALPDATLPDATAGTDSGVSIGLISCGSATNSYYISIQGSGGTFEYLTQLGTTGSNSIQAGYGYRVNLTCADLPVVVLIENAPDLFVYSGNSGSQNVQMAIWDNYSGPLTLTPATPATQVGLGWIRNPANRHLIKSPGF